MKDKFERVSANGKTIVLLELKDDKKTGESVKYLPRHGKEEQNNNTKVVWRCVV